MNTDKTRDSLHLRDIKPYLDRFPISFSEATNVSRLLGGAPSNSDIDLLKKICNNDVSREKFIRWHFDVALHSDDDPIKFIKTLDKLKLVNSTTKNTTIDWKDFKRILTKTGDKLSDHEFSVLAGKFNIDGRVDLIKLMNL